MTVSMYGLPVSAIGLTNLVYNFCCYSIIHRKELAKGYLYSFAHGNQIGFIKRDIGRTFWEKFSQYHFKNYYLKWMDIACAIPVHQMAFCKPQENRTRACYLAVAGTINSFELDFCVYCRKQPHIETSNLLWLGRRWIPSWVQYVWFHLRMGNDR